MQADGNGRTGPHATRWPQPTGLHISSLLSGSAKQFSICPSHTAYPAGHCPTAPYISRKLSAVGWMCCSCLRGNDISAPEMDQAASDEAPAGGGWGHEIKYDGYRMHARLGGPRCSSAGWHTEKEFDLGRGNFETMLWPVETGLSSQRRVEMQSPAWTKCNVCTS